MRGRIKGKKIHSLTGILLAAVIGISGCTGGTSPLVTEISDDQVPDYVDVQIIDVNGKARRGAALEGVNDIVIHYVGNPGTTAQQNHDYFDNPETEVSSHFLVGLEGEIIQCVPLDEKSSASNDRNRDTISVEVCHPDETGVFCDATYDSLVKITAWLCQTYELDTSHILRHYDVTGKMCPLYFVEHEDAWEQFLNDVETYIDTHPLEN